MLAFNPGNPTPVIVSIVATPVDEPLLVVLDATAVLVDEEGAAPAFTESRMSESTLDFVSALLEPAPMHSG
jgi:hypothetical protein